MTGQRERRRHKWGRSPAANIPIALSDMYHPLLTARSAWDAFDSSANHKSIRCAAVFAGPLRDRLRERACNQPKFCPHGKLVRRCFDLIKHRKLAPLQEGWHINCTGQSETVLGTNKELLIHKPLTTYELYAATQQSTGLQSIWQP